MTKKTTIIKVDDLSQDVITAQTSIFSASKPQELDLGLITLSRLKEAIKTAEKEFKDFKAEPEKQIKEAKALANSLEEEIKNKFVEVKKLSYVQKINNETGEVINKEVPNWESGRFIYTEAKKTMIVDKDKLLELDKFTKQITVIDEEALQEYISQNGINDLPLKEVETPEKVGIQFAKLKEIKLLEEK